MISIKRLLPIISLFISLAAALYVVCLYSQISSLVNYSDELHGLSSQLHELSLLVNYTDQFHIQFYNSGVWGTESWLGVPMLQNPLDNEEMQELLFEIKPDVIIEAGTFCGGTALYYATIMDQFKPSCKIITIDTQPQIQDASKFTVWKEHVTSITGSSTDPAIISRIRKQIPPNAVVLVTLDSDHHIDHVFKELKVYSQFVTLGSYLVLQDTNINGHPVFKEFGPGPMEALEDFFKENHDYQSDRSREKYQVTFFPKGWLKRVQ